MLEESGWCAFESGLRRRVVSGSGVLHGYILGKTRSLLRLGTAWNGSSHPCHALRWLGSWLLGVVARMVAPLVTLLVSSPSEVISLLLLELIIVVRL